MAENSTTSPKTLVAGLLISLLLPAIYGIIVVPYFIRPNLGEHSENILGLSVLWLITILLCIHIKFIESRKLSSIGFKSIGIKSIGIAVGIGLLCSLLIPAFYYGVTYVFDVQLGNSIENVAQQHPTLVLISIITAAFTEEVLMRAYPLERLHELTGSHWLGILLSLLTFVLLHSQSWDAFHVAGVVLPLGIILTIIYLKTRNLLFVMIVHFIIDLPLVVKSFIDYNATF